ncbi:MAG: R3H domain-containing nucleic acid-binding protein [Candidatus Paceibacterota bacterium]|jgi:spoIIIJ-associated protein
MINKEEIKKTTEEFFKRADFETSVEVEQKENLIDINIKTSNAQTLIGRQGLVLADIQLLLRKIIKKKTNEDFYISVDIDNYKKNKEDYLKDLAWRVADEVLKTGTQKEIPLVSSFDRRIVHIELQQRNDVLTESIGEGEERRIIVKPAS